MARIKRKLAGRGKIANLIAMDAPICPLCGRPIPPDVPQSRHHLVPRLKGGARGETVLLHAICHHQIHSVLTEGELARDFSTIEALFTW